MNNTLPIFIILGIWIAIQYHDWAIFTTVCYGIAGILMWYFGGVNMTKEKVCEECFSTTEACLEDFYKIGWSAFQIKNKKVLCYCPECFDIMKIRMAEQIIK